MVGAVAGFGDGHGALEQRLGGGPDPPVAQRWAEVIAGSGDVGVVGAVAGFADGHGALEQRLGGGQVPPVLQRQAEVAAGGREVGVVGAVDLLINPQRPLQAVPDLPRTGRSAGEIYPRGQVTMISFLGFPQCLGVFYRLECVGTSRHLSHLR